MDYEPVYRPTFLDDLKNRLDAIKPSQYRIPERQPEQGDHVVGKATDYMKRLHTLGADMREDIKPSMSEFSDLTAEISQFMVYGLLHRIMYAILGEPEKSKRKAERIRALERKLTMFEQEHTVIQGMFWLEAHRLFPEVGDGLSVRVNDNWDLVWTDEVIEQPVGDAMTGLVPMPVAARSF